MPAAISKEFSLAYGGRELWPFVIGGGIARTLHGTLAILAPIADVTMITREAFRDEYERMRESNDSRLPHPEVRFDFVKDPEGCELGPFSSFHHCWSALLFERIRELYPDGGPDIAAFGDYLGEGFVTAQARRSGHPSLRNTKIMVRLHTSLEMVDALDGRGKVDEERRGIYTLERGSIALADRLRAPADEVVRGYRRFYGEGRVAPGRGMPNIIVDPENEPPPTTAPPAGTTTRLLFVARLQRLKGVVELVEAAKRLDRDDWELTLLGGDTDSAPDGGSMREYLERLVAGDKRIVLHDRAPLEQVLELMDQHHVVVIPSVWECWSTVAREALSRNRPVLVTPRGGLPDSAKPGVSGWVMEGTGVDDIERGLRQALDSREEIDAMIEGGLPEQRLHELIQPDVTAQEYRDLAVLHDASAPAAADELISAVIACGANADWLGETLRSLARLHVPVDEVVLASDGPHRLTGVFDPFAVDALEVLPAGAGRAACRNRGIERTTGALVLLLDAGMRLDPRLTEYLLTALRRNKQAGYATAWAHGLDPAAVPLGNFSNLVPEHDNSAVAPLLRRRVFDRGHRFDPDRGSCAERAFFAALADDGLFGCVVPERLVWRPPFSRACRDDELLERLGDPTTSRAESDRWVAA